MRRRQGRWLGVAVGAVLALGVAAPAQATLVGDIGIFLYPRGYNPAAAKGSTATFSGRYMVDDGDEGSFTTVQVRDGRVVARRGDGLELAPDVDVLPGDDFRVLDPVTGEVKLHYTFDGRPALADSTCAGARTFSGTRTGDASIDVREVDPSDPDAVPNEAELDDRLPAGRFSGRFTQPLSAGHYVSVTQSITESGDDRELTYVVSNITRVPSCDVLTGGGSAPAGGGDGSTGQRPAAPNARRGSTRLTRVEPWGPEAKAARFLRSGLRTTVAIDGPGVVSVRLYRADGSPRRGPLLGFGQATSTIAGRFGVAIVPTRAGRRLLEAARGRAVPVYALASVRDATGRVRRARPVRTRLQPPGSVLLSVEPWGPSARRAALLASGLAAMVQTDGPGTVQLTVRRAGAGPRVLVARGRARVDGAGRVRVPITATAAARGALRSGGRLRVTVTGVIRDAAGHRMASRPVPARLEP